MTQLTHPDDLIRRLELDCRKCFAVTAHQQRCHHPPLPKHPGQGAWPLFAGRGWAATQGRQSEVLRMGIETLLGYR